MTKLEDPIYKTYVTTKFRERYPDLHDATDDEVLQVVRRLEVPDASDQEWEKTINKLYPHAPTTKQDHENWLPGVVAAGAIGIGAGVLGALSRRAPSTSFKNIGKAIEAPKEVPPLVAEAIKPEELRPESISELATEPPVAPKPAAPSTRQTHQIDPVNVHAMKMIEANPEYLAKLAESGGGKTIGHDKIWTEAFSRPSMTVEELAAWKPEQPSNTVDVARANILRTYYWDQFLDAVQNNDAPKMAEIEGVLTQIEPGYHNLTATPGRALEFQKVIQFSREIADKISELKSINAPMSQIKAEIEPLIKQKKEKLDESTRSNFMDLITKIEDYTVAAKLTSPTTHAINFTSTGLTTFQRGLEKMLEAGGEAMAGRPVEAEAALKYGWGTLDGLVSATSKFMEEFSKVESDFGKVERGKKRVPPPKFVRPVFQFLSAQDAFWKAIVTDSELRSRAFVQAKKNEKLSGEALAERINKLTNDPPPSWKEEANIVAKEYSFQEDPGRILKAIQAIQHIPLVGRLILPFVTTPYNILSFYNRRSIFGGLSPRFYKEINAGGTRRTRALSRLGVGLGITAGTLALFNLGHITGAYPKNPKERSVWELEGKRPWSIKIGNHWVQYNRLQPIGLYLMTVAAIKSATDENNFQKAEDKFGKSLNQLLKGPLEVPFLQGMSSLFDTIRDPERNWKKFVQLTATGLIPNIVRDVRNQVDPTQRKPETVMQAIKNVIPGVSHEVPARINVLGKEVTSEESRLLRASKMVGSATETDKTRLMNELGWAPPIPRTTFKSKLTGEDIDLEGELKQRFLMEMGEAANTAMDKAMEHKDFGKLSNDQKKLVLQRVTEKLQNVVRKKYQALSGAYGPEGVKKIESIIQETEEGE